MAPRICRICGRIDPPGRAFTQGRCQMCAAYWRRHGVERPPQPPRSAATLRPCSHCAQPTARPRRGQCEACYRYGRRTGRERPPRLWGRG
jgi:hypothetical protein